jgi:hypothetical protein
MTREVIINEQIYLITDEEKYSVEEELIFEIREGRGYSFIAGMWDDILGLPVRKVWKIVGISSKS